MTIATANQFPALYGYGSNMRGNMDPSILLFFLLFGFNHPLLDIPWYSHIRFLGDIDVKPFPYLLMNMTSLCRVLTLPRSWAPVINSKPLGRKHQQKPQLESLICPFYDLKSERTQFGRSDLQILRRFFAKASSQPVATGYTPHFTSNSTRWDLKDDFITWYDPAYGLHGKLLYTGTVSL